MSTLGLKFKNLCIYISTLIYEFIIFVYYFNIMPNLGLKFEADFVHNLSEKVLKFK